MADPLLTLDNIGNAIAAIAALGTASMGLVDAFKVLPGGGPSRIGFGYIDSGLMPFVQQIFAGPGAPRATAPTAQPEQIYDQNLVIRTLRSNWINGVDKSMQKAKAKSLIHLGLNQGSAANLAAVAGVDAVALQSLAAKMSNGGTANQTELNVLGQFDTVLSAVLDEAYERADQKYRNGCKAMATILATVLGIVAGFLIEGGLTGVLTGAAVGLISVPLAPVSKDLVTSLQAAAASIQKTRKVKV